MKHRLFSIFVLAFVLLTTNAGSFANSRTTEAQPVTFPDWGWSTPEISVPDISMPEISMPEITLPEIMLPEITLPEFDWPEFEFPELQWPEITVPEITLPEITLPIIEFPSFELPSVTMPSWSANPVSAIVAFDREISAHINQTASDLSGKATGPLKEKFIRLAALGEGWSAGVEQAEIANSVEPAGGEPDDSLPQSDDLSPLQPETDVINEYLYDIEEPRITVEAVLVPSEVTVISSSRDGKIKSINVENGDRFAAGDVLLEYECADVRAELAAREAEEALSRQKSLRSAKLFKLEIMSDIENLTLATEQKMAEASKVALQRRMESCIIKADYDGRVTNRLANPGEYTRTDRVLLEIASSGTMEAEFLMPSRWLRWVNVGAPLELEVFETGRRYAGRIVRIHGEIDPVSQSIQMTAAVDLGATPLLPGMSGQITVDVNSIREAGIRGFLEAGLQP